MCVAMGIHPIAVTVSTTMIVVVGDDPPDGAAGCRANRRAGNISKARNGGTRE